MDKATGCVKIEVGNILSEFVTEQTSTDRLHPAVVGTPKDCGGQPDTAMTDIENCEPKCANLHEKIRKGRSSIALKAKLDAGRGNKADTRSTQREKNRKAAEHSRRLRNEYVARLEERLETTEARIKYLAQALEQLTSLIRKLNYHKRDTL